MSEGIPFLKWAGGKRWLVEQHLSKIPTFDGRYIEPFLGSGALFFALRPTSAILSDINGDLINAYRAVKENPQLLRRYLSEHARSHSKNYYYKTRENSYLSSISRAAQFIYLNRTCWNGLYRVNLTGKFNVPKGTKSGVILATDDFIGLAAVLESAELRSCDFEETIDLAGKGDFVFADPPYTIHHNQNGFIKYNRKLFSWDDQVRLRDALLRARSRGAIIATTNACHQSIKSLYTGFKVQELTRPSVISGASKNRGNYSEYLIT